MIDFDKIVLGPLMRTFGESSQPLYRFGGAGAAVELPDAVYDEAYVEVVEPENGPPITSTTPVIGVRLALLSQAPAQGDTVYVPRVNETYMVNNIEPDGQGWALLKLTFRKVGQ